MDIRQADTHLGTGADRGSATMNGTGKLTDKIALITGGTTGIGAATATCFQAAGARVIITGSNPATIEAAREQMPGIEVMASDAGDVAATKKLIENVKATYGGIDVLLVNAGISRFNPISMVDEAFFDALFRINVRGAYFVMKHAVEIMPDGGSIILTSSISGALGVAGQTVYGATKAAVRSFGRTFARELAPRRIRVNTISPGPIETPGLAKAGMQPGQMASIEILKERYRIDASDARSKSWHEFQDKELDFGRLILRVYSANQRPRRRTVPKSVELAKQLAKR